MARGNVDWIVAGLGNPGRRYAGTRHDLGFALVSRVADAARTVFERDRECDAETAGPVVLHGTDVRVLLAKPQLFMNVSGPPLARLLKRERLGPERLLVACDDVNLKLGRLRLRPDGSAGGHNGLRSIIGSLGLGFPRLRLGVGEAPAGWDRADWVLDRFEAAERPTVAEMLTRAEAVVLDVLRSGVDEALTRVPAPPVP